MYKLQLKAWSIYGKWQTLCFCCSNRHYLLHDPFKKLRPAENFRGRGSWRFPGGREFPPPRKHAWLKHSYHIKTAQRCTFRQSLLASLRINHVNNYVQPWPSKLSARRVWYPGVTEISKGVAVVINIAMKSQLHTAPLSGSEHFRTFI